MSRPIEEQFAILNRPENQCNAKCPKCGPKGGKYNGSIFFQCPHCNGFTESMRDEYLQKRGIHIDENRGNRR